MVDEPGTNIRVMLLMLVLRRGWIELFAASVLCGTDRPRNVQKFVIKLLFWLIPELISAREQAELSTLARLVAMNDNSTCARKKSVVLLKSNQTPLGRMLRYQKGLMERVLISLLISSIEEGAGVTSKSMDESELEQRGQFLIKLLPDHEGSFGDLIRRWNNNTFHWRVIWELSGPQQEEARRALCIVARLQASSGLATGSEAKRSRKRPRNKDSQCLQNQMASVKENDSIQEGASAVERWVEQHFLGLMWQITHQWQDQALDVRNRRLLTLLEILRCLAAQRLARFVPKVMAILLPNLADDAPPLLTLTATNVLEKFATMLDDVTVKEHLSALVVAVLPLVGRSMVSSIETDKALLQNHLQAHIQQTEKAATRLLRLLIIDRGPALCDRFHTIPFVIRTSLPELEPVRQAFAEAHGNLPLTEELRHLVALLRHDSVQIKRTTLARLKEVLESNRLPFRRLIDDGDRIIGILIHQLFAVCAQNTDRRSTLLCAECLGNIGAIDPAQVHLSTNGILAAPRDARAAPWTMSKQEFALHLVVNYLSSALRESSSMEGQGTRIQDRIAFGIQNLLRIIRDEQGLGSSEAMPRDLERELEESSSLDLIRPLWASSYELRELKEPRKPPFLQKGCKYARWLAQLCRYLIKKSRGPFAKIFEACRGAVKTCTNLAQFLLPYLVMDSLSYGCEEDNEDILEEFLTALRDGSRKNLSSQNQESSPIEPVVVQAVFSLVETLEYWRAAGSTSTRRTKGGRSRVARGKANPESLTRNAWNMQLEDIDRFLQCIPRVGLARAAMRIRAYTRSLRYMDSVVRSKNSQGTIKSSSVSSVIKTLPQPESSDINKMQLIYCQLDEPDGMIGLEALRHDTTEEPGSLQRIRALEHAEQWTAVLQEYEQALQEPPSLRKSIHQYQPQLPSSIHDDSQNYDEERHNENDDAEFDDWESECEGVLESGMLKSLLVLGHLESVLNQYDGMSYRKPQLRPLLVPIAIAAAWRLQRWAVLDTYICHWDNCTGSEQGHFEVSLAKALRAIAMSTDEDIESYTGNEKQNEFDRAIQQGREQVMESLVAASRESYRRAYPLMLRLHILSEAEAGIKMLKSSSMNKSFINMQPQQDWAGRLAVLSPSLPMRAPLVAVRRIIFTSAGRKDMACEDLLSYSKLARVGGNFSLAESAWRQAKCLTSAPEQLLIQEAKLLHAQGRIDRALQVIEPSEIEIGIVRTILSQKQTGRSSSKRPTKQDALNEAAMRQIGKQILFSTDWKVEAGHIHGDPALKLYELARTARPRWARAYFSTAKYYDLMLVSRREKYDLEDDGVVHELAQQTIYFYTESLTFGSKFIFQSMPRLLTLWFEFSLLKATNTSTLSSVKRSFRAVSSSIRSTGTAANRPNTPLIELQAKLNSIIASALQRVPSYMWYTSIQQFISRVGHSEPDVVDVVITALTLIATEHSRESVWSVAQLFSSHNEARRKAGQRVLSCTTTNLDRLGREDESSAFGNSRLLFQDLIKHAQFQTNEKKCRLKLSRNVNYHDYVVPNRETLTVTLQPHRPMHSSDLPARLEDIHDPFPKSANRIQRFHEEAIVMHSKAKPKKIGLITTAGETAWYLCKQEKNGDLRKDARLMEFNAVVNRMLQRDVSGRHRRLRLRTYSVVCLNEECGLLEWVQHTTAFRTLISDAYNVHPCIENPRFASSTVRDRFCAIQQERIGQQEMALRCSEDVFSQFTPCFHRWFLSEFVEPTSWFEARTAYTRSVAAWSAVGHIVGLGDRHCENILIGSFT